MVQKISRMKSVIIAVVGVIILVGIDQLTKSLAVMYLKDQESIVLIPDVFELQYLENHGAAFGMLQGRKWFFLILTVLFLFFLCLCYRKMLCEIRFRPMRILSVCLMAGAIGNMIDRIRYEYVIDFFYFKLIDFPIFNVADIYITISCIVFLIFVLFYYKEEDFNQIFPSRKKIHN